jgi:hypothetical protein
MNRPDRKIWFFVGRPHTGKTVAELRLTDELIMKPGWDSIFVADVLSQHSTDLNPYIGDLEQQLELLLEDDDRVRKAVIACGHEGLAARRYDGPIVRNLEEYQIFCQLYAAEVGSGAASLVPPRVIWRCGKDATDFAPMICEACNQGWVILQFCETWRWYPPSFWNWPLHEIPGRSDVAMELLITEGRVGIQNRRGEWCGIGMIVEAQRFKGQVSPFIRENADVVLCSQLRGKESFDTITREFGDGTRELEERIRRLGKYEWIAVSGEMPKLAPYRGGGRG